MPYFDTHTTVQHTSTNIVVVGEDHHNKYSADLMADVLDYYEPQYVAIEKEPFHDLDIDGAIGKATEYAEQNNANLAAIDSCAKYLIGVDSKAFDVANEFSSSVERDGDVDEQAIRNARQRVRKQFGEETYRRIYTHRERDMAARLRWLAERTRDTVVAAVGAFHVKSIRDFVNMRPDATLNAEDRLVTTVDT